MTDRWHTTLFVQPSADQGRYLNISEWFMKNVFFEHKKIKLCNKHRDYTACIKNEILKYMKLISKGVFLHAMAFGNPGI
jgi:hypothetical protein